MAAAQRRRQSVARLHLSAAGDFLKNKCSLFQFLMKNFVLEAQ
jgi:hypothetical protein